MYVFKQYNHYFFAIQKNEKMLHYSGSKLIKIQQLLYRIYLYNKDRRKNENRNIWMRSLWNGSK